MQRLDDARALRPAGARAGGERDDGDFAVAQRSQAAFAERSLARVRRSDKIGDVFFAHILDHRTGGEAVLREADAAFAKMRRESARAVSDRSRLRRAARRAFRDWPRLILSRGSIASKSVCTMPRSSGFVRQAAPNLSSSVRRSGESVRGPAGAVRAR